MGNILTKVQALALTARQVTLANKETKHIAKKAHIPYQAQVNALLVQADIIVQVAQIKFLAQVIVLLVQAQALVQTVNLVTIFQMEVVKLEDLHIV